MTGGSLGTKLYSASPNPFHDLTRLQFDVASAGSDVRLTVFDPAGRVVKQLQDGCDRPGRYVATWDGTDSDGVRVASGVYYCLFEAGSVRDMRAVALVR